MHARSVAGLVVAVSFLVASSAARAEIMDTTASLKPGNLSLGAEVQVGFHAGDYPFLVNLHEAVGLARGLDLQARQGIDASGHGAHYFGLGIKWTFLHAAAGHRPGIALWLGGHYILSGRGGADVTLAIDYPFGRVRPYLGLDNNIDFGHGDDIHFSLGLIGGVQIGIVEHVAWFVEGGAGFLATGGDHLPHLLSTGPRIYF